MLCTQSFRKSFIEYIGNVLHEYVGPVHCTPTMMLNDVENITENKRKMSNEYGSKVVSLFLANYIRI